MAAKDILEWVKRQPKWHSVALRMLTDKDKLDQAQIDTLASLACKEHGIVTPFGDISDNHAVNESHLGSLLSNTSEIRIESITEIQNVNRLKENAAITFNCGGLTVIYGDNGAGKTGYARVFKRTCTARDTGICILPNIYESTNGGAKAKATFNYTESGINKSFDWEDSDSLDIIFPQVSFFDTGCGEIEVSKKNEVTYYPPSLSLLQRLSETCENVKAVVEAHSENLLITTPNPKFPEELNDTNVKRTLDTLHTCDDPKKGLDSLRLKETEKKEIDDLNKTIANNPSELTKALELERASVEKILHGLRSVAESFDPFYVKRYRESVEELNLSSKNANKNARQMFSDIPLKGVGEKEWLAMWKAVKEYSDKEAYPSHTFPILPKEAKCPLCQQDLGTEAVKRFASFEDYVNGALEDDVKQKEKLVAGLDNHFAEGITKLSSIISASIAISNRKLKDELSSLYSRIMSTKKVPDDEIASGIFSEITHLHFSFAEMEAEIEAKTAQLEKQSDPDEIAQAQENLNILNAKKWVSQNYDELLKNIETRQVISTIQNAANECKTNSITRLSAKLSEQEITEKLSTSFEQELSGLGIKNIPISMGKAGVSKGKITHAVELETEKNVNTQLILSEGEQKCIALAGFFANAKMRSNSSALIFDDPVTSLDHNWRKRIATRLVKEAKTRQVVIFTHDIVFLLQLEEQCMDNNTPVEYRTLKRTGLRTGIVFDGLPLEGMRTKERIANLGERTRTLKELDSQGEIEKLQNEICDYYSSLRSAWERATEEVLLNGAITRLSREVHTKKLKQLVDDIREKDYDLIDSNMRKCSRITSAHDTAIGLQEPLPEVSECEDDLKALEGWVKELRSNKGTRKQRS